MSEIVIMPYTTRDGIPTFRTSEIIKLYNKAFLEGWGDTLFSSGELNSPERFHKYVTSSHILFYGIFYGSDLVGFFWLNRIEQTSAYIHTGFFKQWQGTDITIRSGRIALAMLLKGSDDYKPLFDLILTLPPVSNKRAIKYAEKIGFKRVGEIPHRLWDKKKNKSVPGVLLRCTREDLK